MFVTIIVAIRIEESGSQSAMQCFTTSSRLLQSKLLNRSSHEIYNACNRSLTGYHKRPLRRANVVFLDQEDESLNRWKASLGISTSMPLAVDPSDKRRCIIQSLALEVDGRPDFAVDLTIPGTLESLKDKPFTIKEGAIFRMKAVFRVQHEVLSGLKYLTVVKRKGIRVAKDQEMLVRQKQPLHGWKLALG